MKPWHIGTHLIVLNERYPMNTKMISGLDGFQKSLRLCALGKSNLSIGGIKAKKYSRHE